MCCTCGEILGPDEGALLRENDNTSMCCYDCMGELENDVVE